MKPFEELLYFRPVQWSTVEDYNPTSPVRCSRLNLASLLHFELSFYLYHKVRITYGRNNAWNVGEPVGVAATLLQHHLASLYLVPTLMTMLKYHKTSSNCWESLLFLVELRFVTLTANGLTWRRYTFWCFFGKILYAFEVNFYYGFFWTTVA